MSTTKQTGRGKGRKRAARNRKASASDMPDVQTSSARVALPPAPAPEPQSGLQSKVDSLIGLLAETQPAASPETPPLATPVTTAQPVSPAAHAHHKEMLWCIASLEVAMAALPSRRQGADDDSPLEPIRFGSFSESDRQDVANSVALLKTQPPEPTEPPIDALD